MKKCILVIGVRRKCYKAAIKMGYEVVLWSDGPLNEKRKKNLTGWIEEPYLKNSPELGPKLIDELKKYKIERVVANTEETVILGALVRAHLDLKRLAVDVTDRFHNKWVMKKFAKANDIKITNFKLIEEKTTPEELIDQLGLPLVIKPVDESGAEGVNIAKDIDQVRKGLVPGLLAESMIYGSEVSVETFIQEGKPIFHNITEYLHQWKKSVVPAKLEESLKAQILRMNDKVLESFGVDRGVTHAEFYLTEEGPVFGEIAIRPPGGYYMDLIEKVYGFNSWELYIQLCCEDGPTEFQENQIGHAAVYMMHPGAGKIQAIHGIEKIKENIKGIFDFSIRREIGDVILAHENTSNEVGHILFWAPSREELDKDLHYIESNLVFELCD